MDVWKISRGLGARDRATSREIPLDEALCAVMFNAMGYLFEVLKENGEKRAVA